MTKIIRLFAVVALGLASAFAGEQNTKTQAFNESSRGYVGTGDKVVIVGVIIGGKDYNTVVFRAIGPELSGFHLSPVLQRPDLTIYDASGKAIAHQTSHLENSPSDAAAIASLNLTPTSVNECAIVLNLTPGNYTAVIRGVNNTEGFALAEIYKLF